MSIAFPFSSFICFLLHWFRTWVGDHGGIRHSVEEKNIKHLWESAEWILGTLCGTQVNGYVYTMFQAIISWLSCLCVFFFCFTFVLSCWSLPSASFYIPRIHYTHLFISTSVVIIILLIEICGRDAHYPISFCGLLYIGSVDVCTEQVGWRTEYFILLFIQVILSKKYSYSVYPTWYEFRNTISAWFSRQSSLGQVPGNSSDIHCCLRLYSMMNSLIHSRHA